MPSLRAIAKQAELQPSTLSRWKRGKLRLRPETEQRIAQAVAQIERNRRRENFARAVAAAALKELDKFSV